MEFPSMANATSHPASVDDLLAFIVSAVEDHYKSSRQPTNGADLAEKIRHAFPTFRYEQLGLLKLSDAIAHGEKKGLLIRNRQVKHLEVLPVGTEESAKSVAAQLGHVGTPHIRPDIWRAFVFVSSSERYCFDKETGNVVNEATVGEAFDDRRFVKIPSLSLKEQQQWMIDFVEAKTDLDHRHAPIQDQYCFTKFPSWLREHQSGLDRAWKQFRVQRVADKVRQWAIANSIDPTIFFSAPLSVRPRFYDEQSSRYEEVLRLAITSAVRDLPMRDLLEISIPIRYVLKALEGR
jgi:hypothetical protein